MRSLQEIDFIKFYLHRIQALLPVDTNYWEMRLPAEVDAATIRDVVAHVVNYAPHSEEWSRLVGQLRSLKHLPRDSPLIFLGYFGILEALLTHKPKPTDPYDSITRQVKNKVALLNNNRWGIPIDYTTFDRPGTPLKPEKIWGSMYA